MLSNREDSAAMSSDAHLDDSNLLAAYVEDRLSGEERRIVTKHLVGCEACRATLAAMARNSDDLSAAALVETERVAETPRRVQSIRRIAWLPIAAGLVVATVSGIRFLMTAEPPASAPAVPQPEAGQSMSPAREQSVPRASTPSPQSPQAAVPSGDPANIEPNVLVRRGSERRIGEKTFRLVAGEWIDTAYDPIAALPEVRTATPEETTTLVRRVPALGRYATLGARVLVVLDGTVYRLRGGSTR